MSDPSIYDIPRIRPRGERRIPRIEEAAPVPKPAPQPAVAPPTPRRPEGDRITELVATNTRQVELIALQIRTILAWEKEVQELRLRVDALERELAETGEALVDARIVAAEAVERLAALEETRRALERLRGRYVEIEDVQ